MQLKKVYKILLCFAQELYIWNNDCIYLKTRTIVLR